MKPVVTNLFPFVIKQAWELYKSAFKPIFTIGVVLAIISQALGNLAAQSLTLVDKKIALTSPYQLGFSLIASLLALLICNGLIQIYINSKREKHNLSLSLITSIVLKKLPHLFVGGFIFSAAVLIGSTLYIIPGIIIAVFFYLYSPAILFDNHSGMNALKESFLLTKSQFFPTLSVIAVIFLITYAPAYIMQSIGSYAMNSSEFGIDQVIEIFIRAFTIPFANSALVILYYALKAIKETTAKHN